MREAKKIEFVQPITIDGKEIKEVTMRVPKGKDLALVATIRDQYIADITLISNLCNLNATAEDFEDVDAAEIILLRAYLQSFLVSSPENLQELPAK
jgi:hypothetical protein